MSPGSSTLPGTATETVSEIISAVLSGSRFLSSGVAGLVLCHARPGLPYAATVADVAVGKSLDGVLDVAGPDACPLDELGRIALAAKGDGQSVVTDDTAGVFAAVHDGVLTAPEDARIASTHYTDWLA